MRLRIFLGVCVVLAVAGPARSGGASGGAGVRAPVPTGAVSLSLSCTIAPTGAHGAWIVAYAVDADATGLTESSIMALGWWNDGSLDVVVRTSGLEAGPPPVDVVALGGRYRVTLSATWGGAHRWWPSTLRGGCAASDATVSSFGALVNGADTSDRAAAIRLVTAGPREFASAAGVQGAAFVDGSVAVASPYLLGVFSARAGSVAATPPDGATVAESGVYPSIAVRGGFGGTWRFDASLTLSDDPYLLTALAFEDR